MWCVKEFIETILWHAWCISLFIKHYFTFGRNKIVIVIIIIIYIIIININIIIIIIYIIFSLNIYSSLDQRFVRFPVMMPEMQQCSLLTLLRNV